MNSSDTYDSPDSSPDPYATTYSASNGLPPYIDLSSLPSGLPILGPLTGYTPARQALGIQRRFAQMSETIRRPLTESEQTAIAYYTAKGFAISSYGPTIGIGAGIYRAYATRAQFRWPMYGKVISDAPAEGEVQKGFWDGQKMRAGGKEILQGVSSQAKANILHVSRGLAYVLIGWYFAPLFVSSYAATVSAVGEIRDPRLQESNRGVREAVLRNQKERKERSGEIVKQTVAKREGRMPNVPRERDQGRGRRGGGAEVDDASPTGGAMMEDLGIDEEQGRLSGAGDMGGVLNDGQMSTAEAKARPQPGRSPTSNRAGTFQMDKVERQPKGFGSDFDDASPTSGSGAMDGGDGGGGSVWERIRQQSASEPSDSNTGRGRGMRGAQQEQQDGSTTGDSFSFSNSEEERSYARDEAQKEFDERVEKERRGGDFSSSGGRRW